MQHATHSLLIVDDDASLRSAVTRWAGAQGYVAHPAASVEEAHSIVAETEIDLALLDLRLPDGDGIEFAESLIEADPERPVIVVTAFADLDSARKAVRVGLFEFLPKPFSFEDLGSTVARALQYRRQLIEGRERRTSELKQINDELSAEVERRRASELVLAEQTRSLAEANEELLQNERLLSAYREIARISVSTLNLDEIVRRLGQQLVESRIYRQSIIALVDEEARRIQTAYASTESSAESFLPADGGCSLDDAHAMALVARSGEIRVDDLPAELDDCGVGFYIPIKTEERVLAVIGIAAPDDERERMNRHIEAMQPMLDQVAFALDHSLLYQDAQNYARMVDEVNLELEKQIEERKRAEDALVHLERLGALGEMSAGVSHNLNNILTGILGPAELIDHMTDQEDVLKEAELIRMSALRARDLVARLHYAVKDETDRVGPVELDEVVASAIEAGRPKWKDETEAKGVRVELEAGLTSGAMVGATRAGLQDIVLNLVFNAADALTSAGTIRVKTEVRADRAILTVEDNGVGMDSEVTRRVFDPFFTTKSDVGTGLGLSTVYGQVRRWGGSASVSSIPQQGSTFTVEIPIWKGERTIKNTTETATRKGRVLVVEDEDAIREVVGRILSLRHEVETESDGSSALDTLAARSFDVVLIDLGIPDLPGDRIAEAARAADPDVATVLMTGWPLSEDDPRTRPFDLRIQKPFERAADVMQLVDRAILLRDQRAQSPD